MKLWQSILILALVVSPEAYANTADSKAEKAAEVTEQLSPTVEARLSVDEILNRDPELDDYVDSERCIRRSSIRRTEVLDERHVSVQVSRDEFYIVQFKHRCPGMRRGNPVLLETRNTKLCKHDTLRPMENWGGGMRPGVRCPIPEFQSVTREQLLHLKDSLKTQKRKKKA